MDKLFILCGMSLIVRPEADVSLNLLRHGCSAAIWDSSSQTLRQHFLKKLLDQKDFIIPMQIYNFMMEVLQW